MIFKCNYIALLFELLINLSSINKNSELQFSNNLGVLTRFRLPTCQAGKYLLSIASPTKVGGN